MATYEYFLLGAWTLLVFTQQASGQGEDVFEAIKVLASRLSSPEILKEMSTDNTSRCSQDLASLANSTQNVSLGELQVSVNSLLVALDAFGKPESGILQGDFQYRGSYDECLSIKPPKNDNFSIQYCVMSLTVYDTSQSTWQPVLPLPITEGACVPNSCNQSSFENLLTGINKYLAVNLSMPYAVVLTSLICTEKGRPPFTAGAIVMIVISCTFVAMAILATCYHWISMVLSEADGETRTRAGYGIINESDENVKTVLLTEKSPLLVLSQRQKKNSRLWMLVHDLVMCFSLYKTLPAILTTYQPPAAITCINGMRTISMFWVILAHVFFWMLMTQSYMNTSDLYTKFSTRFSAQPILNGFFSVDSFFFLSGFLVCYLTMREMRRRDGRFPYVPYYVHRFLRLTPTYMFVLFFNWYLSVYLSDGPYYQKSTGQDSDAWKACETYWWTNFLYINNFYPVHFGGCMGWTWYLANDMQFFVISPLVLIPLYLWLPAGIAGISLLFAGSFAVTGFIAGYYRIPANMLSALGGGEVAGLDFPDQGTEIYIKPYCRISPYLVGIALGYIIYRGYRPTINKVAQCLVYGVVWIVAGILCTSTVYGLYETFRGHTFSLGENVTYFMFSRCAWGVGLALIVFACHNGYGGVVNRFLSMPFWVPLGRLTFNAYLVHPIVLTVIFSSQRYPFYYTDLNMALLGISSVVLSYGAASVVTLLVEFPMANVEMTFFRFIGLPLRESVRRVDKQS